MTKPKGYVDAVFLEAAGKATLPTKQRSYALMQIQAGHKVLDVGCGIGLDTINLAAIVQATGQVIGIDFDKEMIDKANQNAVAAGVNDRVFHRHADALQLPFEPNVFDSCRSERLFQHLVEPERALSEMIRVTKPGGWIVVVDVDWGTISADTTEPDIAHRLHHFIATNRVNNGFAGRKLYRLFKQQELKEIIIEPYMIYNTDYRFARWVANADELEQLALSGGLISAEELGRLNADWENANEAGLYFSTLGGIIAAGRKPL